MNCCWTECEWNAQGRCCPESEEMYLKVTPNDTRCPHYYDTRVTEEDMKETIAHILLILKELGMKISDKYSKELEKLSANKLLEVYLNAYSAYQSHLKSKALDSLLDEIKVHGKEWVINKYELNKFEESK